MVDTKELRKAMIDNDIKSVTMLSEVSGVDRRTLADVMNNNSMPSTSVMIKLAKALRLTPEFAGTIFFTDVLRNTKVGVM